MGCPAGDKAAAPPDKWPQAADKCPLGDEAVRRWLVSPKKLVFIFYSLLSIVLRPGGMLRVPRG